MGGGGPACPAMDDVQLLIEERIRDPRIYRIQEGRDSRLVG